MKKELIYLILFSLMMLVACSSEDDAAPSVPNGQPQPGDALELTISAADFVTDGAPDTRATDSGNTTTFKDGDRVGIIILDATNEPIYDNIPYVYNNGNWTFDSNNDEGKGGCYYDTNAKTYIVYYPYNQAADGVTSVDVLKTKFAPKFNQSDIKDYRASDLMVWNSNKHLASSVTTLNAELKHAFASVYLTPTVDGVILDDGKDTPYTGSYVSEFSDISDVSLTIDNVVYVPYQEADGSLRCIVPDNITPGDIHCFYTVGSKTYGNKITISGALAANTRYACNPKIGNVIYSLSNAHVGDFYCRKSKDEGYLIPGDVDPLTNTQQKNCVGIVFWVGSDAFENDPFLKSDHPNCSHGLVVALNDVGDAMHWSDQTEYVQEWIDTNDKYKDVVVTKDESIMRGYSNTLAMVAYNEAKGVDSGYRVLPCDAIQQYSTNNSVPTSSSGWYFPSVKELKYVCCGQGKEGGVAGRDYLNSQIGKVAGGSPLVRTDYYWSSTERGDNKDHAFGVAFFQGWVYFDRVKNTNGSNYKVRVRLLLAF